MKNRLECTWLIVQIFAVSIAAIWAFNVWLVGDAHKLHPQVASETEEVTSNWVNHNKSACMLSTIWSLSNSGSVPANVKDITVYISSVKDNYDFSFDGYLKDYSADAMEKSANQYGTIMLKNPDGVIQAGGEISRDISIAFNPAAEKNEEWFSRNRIMLKIEATVFNKEIKNSGFTSLMKTKFKYQCYEEKS